MSEMIIAIGGEVFNVGGGSRISVTDLIKLLEETTGKKARIKHIEKQKGRCPGYFGGYE